MVKINERHNDIENASEICIRMHDVDDYKKLDDLVSNYSGTHKILLYESDLYNGSPAYIFIKLYSYSVSNTGYTAGIVWKIESGEHLKDDVFDGVYEEIYDVKVDFGIIKKMLETKKILLKEPEFYSLYKNKRNNIYENKVLKLNEYNNDINVTQICVLIQTLDELMDFDNTIYEIDNINHGLVRCYGLDIPIYFFYNLKTKRIRWCGGNVNITDDSFDSLSYLNNVYKHIYNFNNEKEEVKNIIRNKKIDYIPYFAKSPKNIYESVLNKQKYFSQTYYRLPNDEEIQEIINSNLSINDLLNSLKYTIVGRGIMSSKNKDMIIKAINMILEVEPNNQNFIFALKKAQKIIIK